MPLLPDQAEPAGSDMPASSHAPSQHSAEFEPACCVCQVAAAGAVQCGLRSAPSAAPVHGLFQQHMEPSSSQGIDLPCSLLPFTTRLLLLMCHVEWVWHPENIGLHVCALPPR